MAVIPAGTRFEAIPTGTKINLRSAQVNEGDPSYTIEDLAAAIGGGGGIEGESYVFVPGNLSSPGANGLDLVTKYGQAAALTPYGSPLSATNRATVIVGPGSYALNTSFYCGDNYVDVISLTGNQDVLLSSNATSAIIANAGDQYIRGIKILNNKRFQIGFNQSGLKVENCTAGNRSFGYLTSNPMGTYINCTAGSQSFGYTTGPTTVDLTCIGCVSGDFSFGSGNNLIVGGTYTDCTAGVNSFGSGNNLAIGATYTDCIAGINSFGFGDNIYIDANFENCTAGDYSFGSGLNALMESNSKFTNCTSGNNSFGSGEGATCNGTFNNCKAGNNSFGSGITGSISGTIVSVGGVLNNCTALANSFGSGSNDSIVAAGCILTNCTAGDNSFGGSLLSIKGVLIGCRLVVGTFNTVSGPGKTRLCLDGTYTENNQG